MNRKRAVLYLISGLICAIVALYVLQKKRPGGSPGQAPVPTTKVFVARETITFGTPLVPYDPKTKEGNVFHYPWPNNVLPEGAISDPKVLTEKMFVAAGTFVRSEPILQRKVMEKDQIVPKGMFLFDVDVSEQDIQLGKFRPGMYVDIFVIGPDRNLRQFACNHQIYSIGKLAWLGETKKEKGKDKKDKKEEKLPPKLYLLARENHRMALLEARYRQKLLIEATPAGRDCSGGPLLIEPEKPKPPEKPVPKPPEKPRITAKDVLNQAKALIAAADGKKWPDNTKSLRQAAERVEAVTKMQPQQSPEYAEAVRLARQIEEKRQHYETQHEWATTQARMEDALTKGRLAECRQMLRDAEQHFDRDLVDAEGKKVFDHIVDLGARLAPLEVKLKRDFTLFENLLKNKSYDKAVDKYKALKEVFPESEGTKEAERMLKEMDLLK
jgi:hypothetical protein